MTSYGYKAAADALDEVAEAFAHAAEVLRELEVPGDDDRRRELARERTRRYRAKRGVTRRDASRDVTVTRHDPANSHVEQGPSRSTDPREVGRRDAEGPDDVTRATSQRDARDRDDDQPGSPWRIPPLTDEEREAGQQRVRELRDQLHRTRGES